MNPWRGRSTGGRTLRAGGAGLALALALAQRAQAAEAAPPAGLAAHVGTFMGAAAALAAVLVALVAWELLARRSEGREEEAPRPSQAQPKAAPVSPPPEDEEDPFQALLKKSAAPRPEPPAPDLGVSGGGSGGVSVPQTGYTPPGPYTPPTGPSPGFKPYMPPTGPAPAPPASRREEEGEELTPFQRLAQIGSEERAAARPPVPEPPARPPVPEAPARPPKIELTSPPPPAAGGGDWVSLLNKAQAEEAPAAPRPAPPPKVEEDPWKKLLGQAAGEPAQAPAPSAGQGPQADADPWKALLSKASSEAPAPSAPPKAPPTPEPKPPTPEAPADPSRPRSISLDFKRDEGRSIPPPPQTEDE